MSLIVDEHRQYLTDTVRVDGFRRALEACLRPGAIVADLGSGTGILGLLALKAGAARVHAIEATGMIEIARALARVNGLGDRFLPHQSFITDTRLGERVDLAIGDFIGRFGFEAGVFDIYPRVRERLLAADGILIPSAVSIYVAPVEHAAASAQAHFWSEPRHGLLLDPVSAWALNTGYPVAFSAEALLGEPGCVATLPTAERIGRSGITAELSLPVTRPGTLHGLGGWFSASLAPGIAMTNSPLSAARIARRNVFLPLGRAVAVEAGDRVDVRLRILPSEHVVSWRVEVSSAGGASRGRQSHSTLRGMLIGQATLRRLHPEYVPSLTPRGRARLTTLTLCDGRRPLREIEDGVFAAHGDLFRSRDEAAAFVAEVVPTYSDG